MLGKQCKSKAVPLNFDISNKLGINVAPEDKHLVSVYPRSQKINQNFAQGGNEIAI